MHIPVLPKEVIEYLEAKPNENFVDGTIGQGGHSAIILEKIAPNGKVLGIEWDPKQVENCRAELANYKDRLILVNDNYANLKNIVEQNSFTDIRGILLDIGFSSFQVDDSKKGFSFLKDEDLDMRYSQGKNELSAEKIVNEWSELEIQKILEEYGEEKFAKQIAKKIINERKIRKIKTTFELVDIIKKAMPGRFKHDKIHCATRTFQALRIAVNGELDNLKKVLPEAVSVLSSGGRLVIISFHSLEDRIVKNFFKEELEKGTIKILTKKPVVSTDQEIAENPRSRSAKLRAIIKV